MTDLRLGNPSDIMASSDSGVTLGDVLFLAILLLPWITLHPFQSLASDTALEYTNGNETFTYLGYAGLAAAALMLEGASLLRVWRRLLNRPMMAMLAWVVLTSIVSEDPATSMRRLILSALVMGLAAILYFLARSERRLADLLAVAMLVVLALCYGSLVVAPDLAIHQLSDLGEPDLAGDWRGLFSHKNTAGEMLALFVFLGIFVTRSGRRLIGSVIVVLSIIFLYFSGGKSSIALVGVSLAIGFAWHVIPSTVARLFLVFAPAAVLNLFSLGSVIWPEIGAVTRDLPIDPTFTGRTDIWSFAIESVQGHLLTGHGFQAFWNTLATRTNTSDGSWAGSASHAHQNFLDLVVTMGLPGLCFALALFVIQPVRDMLKAERGGASPALLTMFLQIWVFGFYLSATETFFFARDDPMWVTFLFAFFGLRLAASGASAETDDER